jgi:hypothetical protein
MLKHRSITIYLITMDVRKYKEEHPKKSALRVLPSYVYVRDYRLLEVHINIDIYDLYTTYLGIQTHTEKRIARIVH